MVPPDLGCNTAYFLPVLPHLYNSVVVTLVLALVSLWLFRLKFFYEMGKAQSGKLFFIWTDLDACCTQIVHMNTNETIFGIILCCFSPIMLNNLSPDWGWDVLAIFCFHFSLYICSLLLRHFVFSLFNPSYYRLVMDPHCFIHHFWWDSLELYMTRYIYSVIYLYDFLS